MTVQVRLYTVTVQVRLYTVTVQVRLYTVTVQVRLYTYSDGTGEALYSDGTGVHSAEKTLIHNLTICIKVQRNSMYVCACIHTYVRYEHVPHLYIHECNQAHLRHMYCT